jgi:hypothetical protein
MTRLEIGQANHWHAHWRQIVADMGRERDAKHPISFDCPRCERIWAKEVSR